jgi:enoyl-[acyl-carrier protein] reductase II
LGSGETVKTKLTEILKIEHPIMLAGMGGVSYSQLTAAVSNAGGYGCLGASTMSSSQLASEIARHEVADPLSLWR